MSLAVQLACTSFPQSLRFYTDVLGFTTMRFDPPTRSAELERDGVAIAIQESRDAIAPLEYPFGRGVVLVVWVPDAEAVYAGIQAYGARLHAPMQEIWREENGVKTGHAEFEVIDPDGYRMRFCQSLTR